MIVDSLLSCNWRCAVGPAPSPRAIYRGRCVCYVSHTWTHKLNMFEPGITPVVSVVVSGTQSYAGGPLWRHHGARSRLAGSGDDVDAKFQSAGSACSSATPYCPGSLLAHSYRHRCQLEVRVVMRYGSARGTREDAKLRRTAYSGDYFHNRRPDTCGVFWAAPSSRPIEGKLEAG